MDANDLSIATNDGVLVEAEKFNHDLTLQFGVLASGCKDDDDHLNQAAHVFKTKYPLTFFYLLINNKK